MSYTSFSYGKPRVGTAQIASKNSVSISAEVKNTGPVASDEVVQLYLTHACVPGAPLRALAGFRRLHFAPGEKKTVSFVLRARDLSVVDESGAHRIIRGKVQAWIGGGQPLATAGAPKPPGAALEFNLVNEVKLPN